VQASSYEEKVRDLFVVVSHRAAHFRLKAFDSVSAF